MDTFTLGAKIAPHTEAFIIAIEIAADISVSPQFPASADRTFAGTWPGEIFFLLLYFL